MNNNREDDQKKRYLMAKVSTEMYHSNPEYLSDTQRVDVEEKVIQMNKIQHLILASTEAKKISPIQSKELNDAFQSCIDNFPTMMAFNHSIQSQSLTQSGLRQVIHDQLLCDKVLEDIASNIPELNIKKAKDYYQAHQLEFSRGTTWEMSQILITVNDNYEENSRKKSLERITYVRSKMSFQSFEQLAMRYSECPSAMNNGYLGWCEEGKLYASITKALCHLKPRVISQPIETDIGFHLIRYHKKKAAQMATFEEVWPFLQKKHNTRAKHYLQRQWIQHLLNTAKTQIEREKQLCE